MNKEEAELLLAEKRKLRAEIVNKAIMEEKECWEAIHKKDKYYLEKELIKLICSELKRPKNLGKYVKVELSLPCIKFSGGKFINFKRLQKVMKKAGINLEIDIPMAKLIASTTASLSSSNQVLDSIDIPDDTLERLLEKNSQNWFKELMGAYLNYKKSPQGMEETETEIALELFDELTTRWGEMANQKLLNENAPCAHLRYNYSHNIELYADCTRVLRKLREISSEFEFETDIEPGRMIQRFFNIYIKERDYILDEKTGAAKKFVLDGAIK